MEVEMMMEVSLKDGRTGYIRYLSEMFEEHLQNGCVQVKFPFFVASDISEIPGPSEIRMKFNDLIPLDDLTDESRLDILNKRWNDDDDKEPVCKHCNDTGRYRQRNDSRQLGKLVDCDQCDAAETIRRQTEIDQHNAATREALRKQLCESSGHAQLRRDSDGRLTIKNPD